MLNRTVFRLVQTKKMLDHTKWHVHAYGDFWVHWDVGGAHCASFNLGHKWVVNTVSLCSRRQGHFRSDQIMGQWDVVADLDKLVDVDDCKQARRTRLLWWCNGGFGSSSSGLFR